MVQRKRRGASQNNQDENGNGRDPEYGRYREREYEPFDDPEEHHRIESHRFAGGLPATPERYALAREQWSRLPGAVARPSMNPGVDAPDAPKNSPPGQGHSDDGGPKQ